MIAIEMIMWLSRFWHAKMLRKDQLERKTATVVMVSVRQAMFLFLTPQLFSFKKAFGLFFSVIVS